MFKSLFATQSMEEISRLAQANGGGIVCGPLNNNINVIGNRQFHEIPEVEEDDSYGDEDDDDEEDEDEREEDQSLRDDEESKNSSSLCGHSSTHKSKSAKSNSLKHAQDEESKDENNNNDEEDDDDGEGCDINDDEGDDGYGCEEDIPDDLEVCAHLSGYFLHAKDNDLRDIKGGLNSMPISRLPHQRSL